MVTRMPYCNAFDRFNSPCLSEVPNGCDVCEQHTYFYGPTWFERFPFAPEPNPRAFFFSASSKIKAIYEKAILEGRIKVTREHIKRLEEELPAHVGLDYYLLCCMQSSVDPLSSPKYFTRAVKEILNCHKPMIYSAVQADPYLLKRFINPLLNTDYRSFSNMVCHILYCATRLKDTSGVVNLDGPISLIQEIKNHPKFNSEFVWEHSDSEEKLINMLICSKPEAGTIHYVIKKFFLDMKALRIAAHEKQKSLFETRRNEIMEIAWGPERFSKWCLDTEEMKRILEYYKYGLTTENPATTGIQRTLL